MKNLSSFLKSTILFFVSFLVLLSLISYIPQDISYLAYPPNRPVHNFVGIIGAYLAFALFFVFGYAAYFVPFYAFFLAWDRIGLLRFSGLGKSRAVNTIAFFLFIVSLSAFLGLIPASSVNSTDTQIFNFSGITGTFLSNFFKKYLGTSGSFITVFLLLTINAVLLFGLFFIDLFRLCRDGTASFIQWLREAREKRAALAEEKRAAKRQRARVRPAARSPGEKNPEIKVYTPQSSPPESAHVAQSSLQAQSPRGKDKQELKKRMDDIESRSSKEFDPSTYRLPTPSVLKVPPVYDERTLRDNIKNNIRSLEEALADFSVEAKVVSVQKGPVVTMYELQPQAGTKIQKISALSDDIALAMKSSLVRIVAPLPGRGTIGVEIPNSKKHLVFLREVLEEKKFSSSSSKLTLGIGKDVSGNPVIADLKDMPHLLIAGATGSGKTVCVNSLICSILFKARPDEVNFILIDPKMVELAPFAGIPHLIHPIISESKKAFAALNWAVEEMERRYRLLAEEGARNIDMYNKGGRRLSYILIIVDELADLMLVARDSIETAIQRLAQLSRAVGIHLILATQRPSVDVITGVIKANFPARISFKVSSKVDSRTVLDMMGAEKLLGKGDLLFLKPGAVKLIRAQGSYLDDEDIGKLADFIRNQGKPVYEEGIIESEKKNKLDIEGDELFEEAVKIVLNARQASGSILQRRLRVGYTRAARLLDLMEQEGIVGPFCGSKAREIIVDPNAYLSERGLI